MGSLRVNNSVTNISRLGTFNRSSSSQPNSWSFSHSSTFPSHSNSHWRGCNSYSTSKEDESTRCNQMQQMQYLQPRTLEYMDVPHSL